MNSKKLILVFLVLLCVASIAFTKELVVWTWYGAELGQVLQELVKTDFTAKTGIEVDIQVVPIDDIMNKLLLSFIGGDAPDIVELYSNQVVELGIRGALLNLSEFDDIKSITDDLNPMLLPAIQYKSALFALPGEINWEWTYYRTDIFNEMGLEPPQTWDDIRELSIKLKARNMDTYYFYQGDGVNVGKLLPLVFQRGADIFNAEGTASNLDSPEAIAAFKELTALHTDYHLVLEDPVFGTFAGGQTPLQILQNWYYAGLEMTNPQLSGKWDIVLFPGTKQADGSLNRTNTGKMLTWSIVSSSNNKDDAWELMKWLGSTEFTTEFMQTSNRIHGNRIFFSNKSSIEYAPFPEEKLHLAKEALATCRMQTAVIGGHVANRYIDFAFNKVVIQGDNPEAAIRQAAKETTDEIQRKLKEFDRYIKTL
ncbi:MAG: sugar ABC transporter substrate-binding protein [Firmicutes bacterium]|nr:sugar ABC transporter substrate-binding protein [Bacillota bacterium]MDD4263520.1 sugar ABC transporter substrate-binding protein [Bacillota bacterium]MDD4694690.1 sugar ABC transporter substrate-binding protein [Bacillota bacterium]